MCTAVCLTNLHGLFLLPIRQNPFDNTDINCAPTGASSETARYHRTIKTTTNFSGDYVSQMGNWVRAPPGAMQSAALEAA